MQYSFQDFSNFPFFMYGKKVLIPSPTCCIKTLEVGFWGMFKERNLALTYGSDKFPISVPKDVGPLL